MKLGTCTWCKRDDVEVDDIGSFAEHTRVARRSGRTIVCEGSAKPSSKDKDNAMWGWGCKGCGRADIPVTDGTFVEHTRVAKRSRRVMTCEGSFSPPFWGPVRPPLSPEDLAKLDEDQKAVEVRRKLAARRDKARERRRDNADAINEKARARRHARKEQVVDAVRGEASVLLDALMNRRADLNTEFELANFRKLAADKYKLITGRVMQSRATNWRSEGEHHDINCGYCGVLVARIHRGYWSILTDDEKNRLLDRHTTICALQILAGIRDPKTTPRAECGAEPQFYETVDMVMPPDFVDKCPECDAPSEMPCFSVSQPRKDRPDDGSRTRRLKRAHKSRRSSPSRTEDREPKPAAITT